MKLVTAPETIPVDSDLFLAGGITDCPDWQAEALFYLGNSDLTILNPRREFYSDTTSAQEQIEWEYKALHTVPIVSFWFPEETLCPITLYELGVFSQKPEVKLVVGTHPNYQRRFDVITQLGLARPEVVVVDTVEELTKQIIRL